MNINFTHKQFVLTCVAAVLAMTLCFVLGTKAAEKAQEATVKEVIKYVEVIPEENFDVSVLEGWDGDFSDGKIRMIGAWLYGHDNNGAPIVVDEAGELWTLPNYEIFVEDFILLWIANNNTPENVHDDLIVKTWAERYEKVEEVG